MIIRAVFLLPHARAGSPGTAWRCHEEGSPPLLYGMGVILSDCVMLLAVVPFVMIIYVKGERRKMQDIITIIQTVGFPIASAVAMFLMLQSEQKAHKEESAKLTETINDMKISFNDAIHSQENKITEAINNNTMVIQKLLDKIEGEN